MIRVGMIGSDGGDKGGHALSFCKILNGMQDEVKITGLYGDNAEEAKALAAAQNISYLAEKPEDLLGKVDAVFVMQRDGNRHAPCAMPFAEAGLPIFIDKPFTCSVEDADRLVATAKKSGSLLFGGSYVKYAAGFHEIKEKVSEPEHVLSGYLAFPIYLDSPYGMHFYSHHLIEEMLEVFGIEVQSVMASRVGDRLVVIAKYKDFPVIMNFAANYGGLHAGIYLDDGTAVMKTIDIAGYDSYQCKKFLECVKLNKQDESKQLLLAVKISNAILQSMETGKEICMER